MTPVPLCGVLLLAGLASAQPGLRFEIEYGPGLQAIRPGSPSCTVRVLGGYAPPDYAFASARWDVVGSDAGWSDPRNLPGFAVGGSPGSVVGAQVQHIIAGQVHFPGQIWANPVNPAPLWEAEWSTANFTARRVHVQTTVYRYDVYISSTSPASASRYEFLVPFFAEIRVVPAAGGVGVVPLILGPLLWRRRR